MFKKINALKERANKQIIKGYVSTKALLTSSSGEQNLAEGVSIVKIFVIGGLVLALLLVIFNGPITDWFNATVGSWFKAGGEARPV